MSATTLDDATRAVIAAWERLAEPEGLLAWLESDPSYRLGYYPEPSRNILYGLDAWVGGTGARIAAQWYAGGTRWAPTIAFRHSERPYDDTEIQLPVPQWVSRLMSNAEGYIGTGRDMTRGEMAALIRETLAEERQLTRAELERPFDAAIRRGDERRRWVYRDEEAGE